MPAPCKFFAQGTCRNGNNCRFLHVSGGAPNNGGNRYQTHQQDDNRSRNNRDGRFNQGGDHYRPSGPQQSAPNQAPYMINKGDIEKDLTSEKPQWPLSAYGPGRNAPEQLFGGAPREQSFEEMRLLHYIGVQNGNPQAAIQQTQEWVQLADQQNQTALQNPDAAMNFILSKANEHPNRWDIIKQSTATGQAPNLVAAGNSALNPVGGNSGNSAPNPFGGNTGNAAPNPFGQPSGLGQKPNPFGRTQAQNNQRAPFGQPANPSPFSQPAVAKPNPFGAPQAQQPAPNPFAAPAVATNPFGQPAAGAQQLNPLQQQQNPFGAPRPAPSNPFGGNTASGPQPPNPFFGGQPSAPSNAPNPFNAGPSQQPAQQQQSMANGADWKSTAGPDPSTYIQRNGNRLTSFKGKPVVYRGEWPGFLREDGAWERIFFPDGPPAHHEQVDMPGAEYTKEIKAAYLYAREHGSFPGGIMPMLPPKREWTSWDF